MRKISALTPFLTLIVSLSCAQTIVNTEPGPRKAILEEFTGVNCVGCPDGHAVASSLLEDYPNQVFVISYSPTNSGLTTPTGNQTEFRRAFLDAFYMHAYCAPETETRAMPTAFINRRIGDDGDRLQPRWLWEDYALEVMNDANSPMNIGVRSTYNESANTLTIDVEIYYHTDVQEGNSFYVFLAEHGLESYSQSGASQDPYIYENNTFRETVTAGQWGDPVTGSTTAGSLFSTQLTFDLADAITPLNIENVDVLAFVIEDQTTEIYTGIQASADGGLASTGVGNVGVDELGKSMLHLFPNPATDMITLSGVESGSQVSIINAVGQTIRGIANTGTTLQHSIEDLDSGIYFIQVVSDKQVSTMPVVKH